MKVKKVKSVKDLLEANVIMLYTGRKVLLAPSQFLVKTMMKLPLGH